MKISRQQLIVGQNIQKFRIRGVTKYICRIRFMSDCFRSVWDHSVNFAKFAMLIVVSTAATYCCHQAEREAPWASCYWHTGLAAINCKKIRINRVTRLPKKEKWWGFQKILNCWIVLAKSIFNQIHDVNLFSICMDMVSGNQWRQLGHRINLTCISRRWCAILTARKLGIRCCSRNISRLYYWLSTRT